MPAKGKHRRPKSQRFTRSIAVAGTGGAALALPLLGATGAHAATAESTTQAVQSLSETAKSVTADSVSVQTAKTEKSAAAKKASVRTYAVRAGDYLSKIAQEESVSGGWQKLYSDNRTAIGADPSLIHPGLKLTIGKKAASTSSSSAAPSSSSTSTRKTDSKPAAESATAETSTTTEAADTSSSSGFTLPVTGATIGTGYRVAGSMWSSGYHTGVDFVVPTGTSLKAVGAGTVVSAGWGGAYGNQVVIQLADGYYAQYAHLSQLSVSAGQSVSEGQQIGLSGATGNVTGPHLHFEIRTTPDYGSDIDPVGYLRSKGVAVG
ncbi:LysM peptidoglycan-binding domain-containing M23 family metallopeptidase [Streptomyces sp. WI04-05B]|uniref:M23 family metallopeptidase n=1 Tax=Streptomyces TaxID=1883 RepID=UPI0029BCB370|nr:MULTISPECIES: LysM peptidoglycan-binding domain-containing M23 family metallopeptidase [unclassified Streptomyces]MDX2547813.1 LysM peptidoglycan-binding domain-containing M23 family metallopeptidase [Streptomyces sp. WI04-05B]MDX2583083.1 LysM peptidoglycan-binding domain-containing M23 family metallopeptidase [Streptomyces sp. WI04-05A]MDX3748584.1 LysM peptidoglycan-binding domain-containing M23 family metallopeptidase [Streptomyces sp. AK08-02]